MNRKHILTLALILTLATVLSACGKEPTVQQAIESGTYNWDEARELCTEDITNLLNTIMIGESNEYAKAKAEWLPRVKPEVQNAMFPRNYTPPKDCSVTITYRGYSSQEHNSEGSEFIAYEVRVLNNTTLASTSYDVVVELGRGSDGYIIEGYTQTRLAE